MTTFQMTGEQTMTSPVPALQRNPPVISFRLDCSNLKSDLGNQQLLNSYSPVKVSHQEPSLSLAMAKQERCNRERDGRAGRREG